MTRDEILNMPAGREMDALIAQKIMKLKLEGVSHYWANGAGAVLRIPSYSTDIAAAWDVANKFNAWRMKRDKNGFWFAVWRASAAGWEKMGATGEVWNCDNAPIAICRAALLTVMDK